MPCWTEAACNTNRKKKSILIFFFLNLKISRGKKSQSQKEQDSSLPVEVLSSRRWGPPSLPMAGFGQHQRAASRSLCPRGRRCPGEQVLGHLRSCSRLLSLGRGAFPGSGIISPSPVSLARPCSFPCTPSPPTQASFSLLNPLMGLGRALPL